MVQHKDIIIKILINSGYDCKKYRTQPTASKEKCVYLYGKNNINLIKNNTDDTD